MQKQKQKEIFFSEIFLKVFFVKKRVVIQKFFKHFLKKNKKKLGKKSFGGGETFPNFFRSLSHKDRKATYKQLINTNNNKHK
jgi:hypothetical protein